LARAVRNTPAWGAGPFEPVARRRFLAWIAIFVLLCLALAPPCRESYPTPDAEKLA